MLNTELINEYLDTVRVKRDLESSLRSISQRADALELQVVEMMLQAEAQRVTVNGNTVSLAHRDKVSPLNKEALIAALQATGHGELVKADIHYMRLNAWYNELGGEVPDEVRPHLSVVHEVSARVREG